VAYVAEDEAGKAQVQDYLELLAIKHFRETLETEGPGLLPPKAVDAAGEYQLGTVQYNGRDLYPFGLRENEWTQHVGVFGRSGAGKTNLGFLIARQLLQQGKPMLILDWKRNYRDLVTLPGFEHVAVYTVGRTTSPLSFNPLIPPPQTPPQTWLKKLIGVIAHAYLLGDGVIYLLQEALDEVYERSGVNAGSVDVWPTFADVLAILKRRQTIGREAGWMSSALRAIASLCFGEMGQLLNQGHDDIAALLKKPVILELDALTQSDKVFFTSAVLLWIHHHRMAESTRESFKHAIIIPGLRAGQSANVTPPRGARMVIAFVYVPTAE
jgi:type IV secretory pathway VirB4 component